MSTRGQAIPARAPRARPHADPRLVAAAPVALVLAATVAYPLARLLAQSLAPGGHWSLDAYARALSPVNLRPLWNTIWVSATSSALAVVAGSAAALLVVRTDLPGRRWLRTLIVLPYATPPFFGAIGWAQLLGPQGYLLRPVLSALGIAAAPQTIYSPGGVVLVLAIYSVPLVFLTVAGALEQIDASLEDAARASGAGPLAVMRQITLPLVAPAMLASGVLAFMAAATNFGVPALLGARVRFFVLTTSIYRSLNIPDFPLATALSMLLVAVSAAALLLLRRISRGPGRWAVISGRPVPARPLRLRGLRWPAATCATAFAVAVAVLPLAALALTSCLKYYGAPLAAGSLTVRHYAYIAGLDEVRRAMRNSAILATLAAGICAALGTAIAYAHLKARVPASAVLDALGTLPYAIPHTVIAIAVLLAWAPAGLYGTLWIILLAYVVAYLPTALRTVSATLEQVHGSLEDAARTSGAGPLRAFRDITLPLARAGVLAGGLLVFLPTSRELTMSILLFGLRTETIGVAVFNLQDGGDTENAAALAIVALAALLVANLAVRRATRGQVGL